MGKGYKHGACGNPLNFKVVGGTSQPNDPKENMIWVNTETKITGWYFASEQPENMAEGEVLFLTTGKPSGAEFNTLKKNNITVYPYGAKQMVSGALVDVTAKSYRDGEWVSWAVYLYDSGDQCDSVTGGWGRIAEGSPTFTVNADSMTVKKTGSSGRHNVSTNNKIDLTNYKTIEYVSTCNNKSRAQILVFDDNGPIIAGKPSSTEKTTNYLDISSANGKYYVGFGVIFSESSTFSMNLYSMKLI